MSNREKLIEAQKNKLITLYGSWEAACTAIADAIVEDGDFTLLDSLTKIGDEV